MNELPSTAEKVSGYFTQGSANTMAIAIADLIVAADPNEVTDTAFKYAGWAIANLLRVAGIEEADAVNARIAAREAELAAEKARKERISAYFDPDTSEEARSRLEAELTDDDLEKEAHQIEYQRAAWRRMASLGDSRLARIRDLKARRAVPVEGQP